MAKLTFEVKGKPVTVEGTEEEVISLYERLTEREIQTEVEARQNAEKAVENKPIGNMPSVEQLTKYILTKSNYEHDIIEIQDRFLAQRITSRGNPSQYRKLSNDLQKARKVIEVQRQGAFEAHTTTARNLKKYIFKPLSRSLTEVFQKQS